VLGPVSSSVYLGGVAVFTESLADGFKKAGCEVALITSYSEKKFTQFGVPIITATNFARITRQSFSVSRVVKLLNEFKPDLVLSSLAYGLINLFYKRSKRVYYLHGFPTKVYGYIKSKMVIEGSRLFSKHADITIANSSLTKMINQELYGLRVDYVVNPGVSFSFLENLKRLKTNTKLNSTRSDVLYVGRLVRAKGLYQLVEAMRIVSLRFQDVKLLIAGDGPERNNLIDTLKKNGVPYVYLGILDQNQLLELYLHSKVFVSLNSHEPFGITYLEAALAGCKIVCPVTGGHMDFSSKFPGQFYYVTNAERASDVAEAIIHALERPSDPAHFDENMLNEFSYETVATKILQNT
jgi:glycosyltransferase involved in cell wall biosynthesis